MCSASLHTLHILRVFKASSGTNRKQVHKTKKAKNPGWPKVSIVFMSFRPKLRVSKESKREGEEGREEGKERGKEGGREGAQDARLDTGLTFGSFQMVSLCTVY